MKVCITILGKLYTEYKIKMHNKKSQSRPPNRYEISKVFKEKYWKPKLILEIKKISRPYE